MAPEEEHKEHQQTGDEESLTSEAQEQTAFHEEEFPRLYFFASRGAQASFISNILVLIFVFIAMVIFQKPRPFLPVVVLFLFFIYRSRKRLTSPVVEIDNEHKTLAVGKTKFTFDEVKSWSMTDTMLTVSYENAANAAQVGDPSHVFSVSLRFFEEEIKTSLAQTLTEKFGAPVPIQQILE